MPPRRFLPDPADITDTTDIAAGGNDNLAEEVEGTRLVALALEKLQVESCESQSN